MLKQMLPALRIMVLMTGLTGLIYPAFVTACAKLLFANEANGSLAISNGQAVGSSLLGQNFTRPEYFHPRPSAAGPNGYDASSSSGSNLAPTSEKLFNRVKASADQFRLENPDYDGPIPADAVTASGSGLDPHISPAYAMAQISRVAGARRVDPAEIERLVDQFIENRDLGLLGEPRVNVLLLNLAVDKAFSTPN